MESVKLRRIDHREKARLALYFKPGGKLDNAVRSLSGVKFSITHKCWYLDDTPSNFELVLNRLNSVAEVDQSELQAQPEVPPHNSARPPTENADLARRCVRELQDKMSLRGFSQATYKTYTIQFELFLKYYKYSDPLELDDADINNYLLYLSRDRKLSVSARNQSINAIKFFYERVARRERRTYYIERPLQEKRLPTVLSEEEVVRLFTVTTNLKHKLMLMVTYAGGMRRSEVLNLRIGDIDVDRCVISVRGGKGRKDRDTTLGETLVPYFKQYMDEYRPVYWLFEGAKGAKYSESSFQKIFVRAVQVSGIRKEASLHTLRHSFATHSLEAGLSTRYIQRLLGHNSVKTTELYTQVTRPALDKIRSPLDRLKLPPQLEQGDGGAQ